MSDPWTIIQNAVFGYTGCDGNMADRTASAIENLLEQAGYDITPIERQPAPPASGDVGALCERLRVRARCGFDDDYPQALSLLNEAATLLESRSRNGEVERLREALTDIRARTYSTDLTFALTPEKTSEVSKIASTALQPEQWG